MWKNALVGCLLQVALITIRGLWGAPVMDNLVIIAIGTLVYMVVALIIEKSLAANRSV